MRERGNWKHVVLAESLAHASDFRNSTLASLAVTIMKTVCSALLLVLTLSLSILAQSPAGLREAIDADYASHLWPLFDHWHRNPELSLMETKTADRLAKELRDAGFKVREGVGGTGVVAIMENGPGPMVMMRADMDGLPIEEKSGLPNASTGQAGESDYGRDRAGDARLRTRCSHHIPGRDGSANGIDKRPMVGHANAHRTAGRGTCDGRARHDGRQPLESFREAGLCPRVSCLVRWGSRQTGGLGQQPLRRS